MAGKTMTRAVEITFYDPASGRVRYHARVSPSTLPAYAEAGLHFVEGRWPADAYEIDAGVPVLRRGAEVAAERLTAARADALARLPAALNAAAETVTGRVPEYERASWPQKETAARALLAGQPADPMLAAEAGLRRETERELAARIVAKADAYRLAAGILAGRRDVAEAAIHAATTPDQIAAALDDAGAPLTTPTERN